MPFDINDPLSWILELAAFFGVVYVGNFTSHHWGKLTAAKFHRLGRRDGGSYENQVRGWLIASRILWALSLLLVFVSAGLAFFIDWQANWVIITFYALWFAGILLEKWWPRWYFEVTGPPSWLAFVIFIVEWLLFIAAWIILLQPGFGGVGHTPTGIYWASFIILVVFSGVQLAGLICLFVMRKRTVEVLEAKESFAAGGKAPGVAQSSFVSN